MDKHKNKIIKNAQKRAGIYFEVNIIRLERYTNLRYFCWKEIYLTHNM